jgi:hypothetical protein
MFLTWQTLGHYIQMSQPPQLKPDKTQHSNNTWFSPTNNEKRLNYEKLGKKALDVLLCYLPLSQDLVKMQQAHSQTDVGCTLHQAGYLMT